MAFESGAVRDDWNSAGIVPMYKGKGNGRELNTKVIEVLVC